MLRPTKNNCSFLNFQIFAHSLAISEFAPNDSTTGTPKYYANWEDNVQTGAVILVAPTPAAANTVQINYIKENIDKQNRDILEYSNKNTSKRKTKDSCDFKNYYKNILIYVNK